MLRIHGGRVLAWDARQGSYVPLEPEHLDAIAELQLLRHEEGSNRSTGTSTATPAVCGDLVALGLVTTDGEGGADPLSNGPNAAAAAAQEVMVELGR